MEFQALKQALLSSTIAGIIAFVVFAPITGIILDDYTYTTLFIRPSILAGIVFSGRLIIILCSHFLKRYKTHTLHYTSRKRHLPSSFQKILISVLIISAFTFPWFSNNYWITLAILTMIYILLGLGLNIVVGLAGLLDLGFVAFYAVGAYGYALGAQYFGLSFWLAIPLCALMAAGFGAILGFPVLRMHGDYLAIVTLGFGEIIRLVLNNWTSLTGGPNGIHAPKPTLFGLSFARNAPTDMSFHDFFGIDYSRIHQSIFIYLALLLVVLMIIVIANRLRNMPIGRAWEALREDEIACRTLGIYHVTTKLSAFSIGAFIGGIGGVFFAGYQNFINPSSFSFIESALILAIVVLGGMGSIVGVIIAAIVVTILPEILRDFATYRVLIFGLLMVLMMIFRPSGLIQVKRKSFTQPSIS